MPRSSAQPYGRSSTRWCGRDRADQTRAAETRLADAQRRGLRRVGRAARATWRRGHRDAVHSHGADRESRARAALTAALAGRIGSVRRGAAWTLLALAATMPRERSHRRRPNGDTVAARRRSAASTSSAPAADIVRRSWTSAISSTIPRRARSRRERGRALELALHAPPARARESTSTGPCRRRRGPSPSEALRG
jgi:hypothetical protein